MDQVVLEKENQNLDLAKGKKLIESWAIADSNFGQVKVRKEIETDRTSLQT